MWNATQYFYCEVNKVLISVPASPVPSFLLCRWMIANQREAFAVQPCPMLLPPLRGWPRSRMDTQTHVTGTECSLVVVSPKLKSTWQHIAFAATCILQLCNAREPRCYGQWYPKSCLSSTGHHPASPDSRLRLHCGQPEACHCTLRLCWSV